MANEKRLDLINRQALGIGRCNPDVFPLENRGYCAGWNGVISLLEQAPRVDAVEVVRCKVCVEYEPGALGRCKFTGREVNEKFFCAWGERKKEE